MNNFRNLGDLTNLDNLYDTGTIEGTKNIQILFDRGLARRLRDDLELSREDFRELKSIAKSKHKIKTPDPYNLIKKRDSSYGWVYTGLLQDCRVSGLSLTLRPLDLENLDKGEIGPGANEKRIITYNSMNVKNYRHAQKLENLFRTYLEFVVERLEKR